MGRIKALIGFLVLASAIYFGWLLVPVYFANYQFQDSVVTLAKFSGTGFKTEDEIKEDVLKKAKELGVPVKPDDVKVHREGTAVDISANYVVVIDLINGKQIIRKFIINSNESTAAK